MPQLSTFGASSARGFGLVSGAGGGGGGPVDTDFDAVTLLLPGNGTNGAQNNTFLDSSTNNFSITRNGNTTQGTFSPFSQTGWSNYFDGSGDYLSFTKNTTTGSFTCECWFYRGGDASGYHILFSGSSVFSANPDNTQLSVGNTGYVNLVINGTVVINNTGTAVTKNQWNHIAWVRSGTTCAIFVNGSRMATGTSSAALNVVSVGTYASGYEPNGYISNARIVNAAVYDPASTSITVPTAPLTAISNTYLLTCQSNRFVDNSSNAFAITINGNPSVQAFSPFNPTAAYSAATNGGSGYFDGTGDYLSVADSSAFTLGTGDFTVEAWVYTGVTGSQKVVSGQINSGGDANSLSFQLDMSSTDYPRIIICSGTTTYIATSSSTLPKNSWVHLASVRDGNTLRIYVNGVQTGTQSVTGVSVNDSTANVGIGRHGEYAGLDWNGYISGYRFVKGTAVYPSGTTFTPPTAPPTAITNTSLLCNFTNAGITDATAKNDLETVGDSQISTAQSKFGGSSMAFDGNADYLTSPVSTLYEFGTGDFTVELWVRFNSTSGTLPMINLGYGYNGTPNGAYNAWGVVVVNNVFYFSRYLTDGSSNDFTASWTPATNTWYHVAVSRQGTSLRAFIDGTQLGTTQTNSVNYVRANSDPLYIGQYYSGNTNRYLNGYIDDLRITKGYARYTSNFTAPTAPFPLL